MDGNPLQESVGQAPTPPSALSFSQEELCKRLDEFHEYHELKVRPSEMFKGAVHASKIEHRSNPDWIPQAAHSLREIIYPFGKEGERTQALEDFGSVSQEGAKKIGKIYGTVTELAHHGNCNGSSIKFETFTPADFDKLIAEFEQVMIEALSRQADIHQQVDDLLGLDPT